MSQEQQQGPTAQDGYNYLYENLHAPVFFKKLAQDHGIAPQSPQEALDLLSLGGGLFQSYQAEQTKQASAGQSRFSSYLNELTGGQASVDANDQLVKQASLEAAQNPAFAQATLLLQAQAARNISAQQAAA